MEKIFQSSPEANQAGFRPSRFTIRVKLSIIISVIVALSISVMIYLASALFKESNEILIQDYNLSLARMIGNKLETDLEDISYNAQIFAGSLVSGTRSPEQRKMNSDLFFRKNRNIVFLAIITEKSGKLKIENSVINDRFVFDYDFRLNRLNELSLLNSDDFIQSTEGVKVLKNFSKELHFPAAGFSFPLRDEPGMAVLIYLASAEILKSFQANRQNDIFELFIVDRAGNTIAHSNESETLERPSSADVPIVKKLLESSIDNGSQKYIYRDTEYLGSFQILNLIGLGVVCTIPTEKAFEAVFRIQRQNFLIMIIVMTTAFAIVFLFAKTLSVPIVNLVAATKQVERGNFHVKILPTTRDEIGLLTNSFTHMAKGLWEREKIKNEFGKFVSPEIAERALRDELRLGGENKVCTVLFSDIRSFTSLSESRSPEEVVEILNDYFTEMVDCVQETGGTVDKFIGDAIMATWGSIIPVEEDARKAVMTALKMRSSLIQLNKIFVVNGKPEIKIGCGINTGSVIAGQIGSMKRLEYTVIGDAVNLASRIEYLNKQFVTDILISDETFRQCGSFFRCVQMPPVEVRGKEKPQIVHAVLGEISDPGAPKDISSLRKLLGIADDA